MELNIRKSVYEKLMERSRRRRRWDEPEPEPRKCIDCPYFHPDWPYRSCYFVECPYKVKRYTIRKRPLFPEIEGLVIAVT